MRSITLLTIVLMFLGAPFIHAQTQPEEIVYLDPIWSPTGEQIIFTSNRDKKVDIWSIQPDGSNLTNLTMNIAGETGLPVWSPNGEQIAFLYWIDNQRSVWVVNSDGQEARRISPENTTAVIENVEWSPDGRQIALATYATNPWPVYTLWIVNLSGDSPRLLAEGSGPNWSPDGQWIAFFVSDENNNIDIGLLRPDGSHYQLFDVNLMPFFTTLVWSPDSQQIAYNSSAEPLLEKPRGLWVIDIATMQPRQLTHDMRVGGIRYSPDGSTIGFRNELNIDTTELWLIEQDGSNLRILIAPDDALVRFYSPEWSPDGQRVVFTKARSKMSTEEAIEFLFEATEIPENITEDGLIEHDIWLMNTDGSNLVNLTPNIELSAGYPKWSPDGRQIAFTTGGFSLIPASFTDAIWIMDADGSNQRMLIGNEADS